MTTDSWTGAYFGLSFASGEGNTDTSFTLDSTFVRTQENVGTTTVTTGGTQASTKLNGDTTGSNANLLVGYNFQIPRYSQWVIGGQLEGNIFNNIILSAGGNTTYNSTTTTSDGIVTATDIAQYNQNITITDNLHSMFTFMARAGYLVKPNILIYVLGGGVEGNFALDDDQLFNVDGNVNKWVLGYTLGAGLEYKFNKNWSLRGEYRYLNFNIDRHFNGDTSNISDPDGPNNLSTSSESNNQYLHTHFNFNELNVAIVYGFA